MVTSAKDKPAPLEGEQSKGPGPYVSALVHANVTLFQDCACTCTRVCVHVRVLCARAHVHVCVLHACICVS